MNHFCSFYSITNIFFHFLQTLSNKINIFTPKFSLELSSCLNKAGFQCNYLLL